MKSTSRGGATAQRAWRRHALIQRAQPFIAAALECAWSPAFHLAGRWLCRTSSGLPPALDWQPAGAPVVILAPHPDDETLGCGGTLLRHREAGDEVHVVCATDGRRSRALPVTSPAMARVRAAEAAAACAALDVHLHWLGWPEGNWDLEAGVGTLRAVLERLRPALIYAPSWLDFHPEHRRVAHALALGLRAGAARGEGGPRSDLHHERPERPLACVRVYPSQVPLTPAWANRVCEVTHQAPRLARALEAHASQWHSVARGWRQRRHAARLHGRGRLLEEFRDLRPVEYVTSHEQALESWPAGLRGLRHTPLDDAAVYLRVWRLARAARHTAL